ncbi:F/Y rich C-terminus-domain-containing protein [Spinellus fusiger]|nr:F/Y rich C-terminus-domain-containing protein [Spinellus fusiger]
MTIYTKDSSSEIESLVYYSLIKKGDLQGVSIDKYTLLKLCLGEKTEQHVELLYKLTYANKKLRYLVKEKVVLLDRLCKHSDTYRFPMNQPLDPSLENCEDPTTDTPKAIFLSENINREDRSLVHFKTAIASQGHIPPIRQSKRASTSPPLKDPITSLSPRPKLTRKGLVGCKLRCVQPLEKDETTGNYKLPDQVGILTVHSLGQVVPLTTYHNDRYIWPPGYKVSRTYLSMVRPNANTIYTCTIEENGNQGPKFRVVADDCAERPLVANSATGVWTIIVKKANEIRMRYHSNSASGPDYYGLTHATIAKMIQDLPRADQCLNYVWQKFDLMQKRTAAGVAATAQKKLNNLEIIGSANKRPPPPKDIRIKEKEIDSVTLIISQDIT